MDWWDKFWKDKHGNVVVYQRPNLLLIVWLVIAFVSLFVSGKAADVLWYASHAVLAIWSLLEIVTGVNYLRRALGLVVLLITVAAVFQLI